MRTGKPENVNFFWSDLVVEELIRLGVDYFCISPGSRSAPLTMSAARHRKARTVVHFDERGSAFHALGYAAATGRPCALITTSGTAVANLFPAIVEASKKKLPLIILTGDRPPELRHAGANQTIDQVNIFGSYVRWFFDLPAPSGDVPPAFVLTTVDQAVYRAQGDLRGPVHVNCMFREPLHLKKEGFTFPGTPAFDLWAKSNKPLTQYVKPARAAASSPSLDDLARLVRRYPNGIIAVGKLGSEGDRQAVLRLARKLRWPVFPDVCSGLRLEKSDNHVIHYYDRLLANGGMRSCMVDGIIHIGGRMTSKAYYQSVGSLPLKYYCMVLDHPLRNDPTHQVTHRFHSSADQFVGGMFSLPLRTKEPPYLEAWRKWNRRIDRIIEKGVFSEPVNEYGVLRLVSKLIPRGSGLFLANSLPIREMDGYGSPSARDLLVSANRGASGIDGNIATVSGLSRGWERTVTAVLGDLACLHDLNSLSLIGRADRPAVLIILNNHGGGIFSFLPIAQENRHLDRYFTASHGYRFAAAAAQFDLKYACAGSFDELADAYRLALRGRRSAIIEVPADNEHLLRLNGEINEEIGRILN